MAKFFYQMVGLVLGFIIGALTIIGSLSALFGWAYYTGTRDARKSTERRAYQPSSYNREAPGRSAGKGMRLEFESREEAEEFLESIMNVLDNLGHVTVKDIRVGRGVQYYAGDESFGWKSLSGVEIYRGKSYIPRYYIDLPEQEQIAE